MATANIPERFTDLTDESNPVRYYITAIYNDAFKGCEKLTEVNFNSRSIINSIGSSAFEGCTGLTSIVLPKTVKSIGEYAFQNCAKLTTVEIPNSVENLSAGIFLRSGLTSIKIPNSIKSIGRAAFRDCTALEEVIVPPSVESIGEYAFAGNTTLASIIMGHNVKTIGEKAFDGYPASTISITAQTPPTAPNNTFSNYTGKLYLQGQNAVDAYYNAFTCWDRFKGYVMIEASEILLEGDNKIEGKPGDTFQLKATIMPENVTLPQLFWRSTNPEIATVDANGLVTLHADLGEVMTMAAGDADISANCQIIAETLYADGPVLEVTVNDSITGIKEKMGDCVIESEIDFNAPLEIYNLNGVMIATSIDNLVPGIYIIRQDNSVQKIVVK